MKLAGIDLTAAQPYIAQRTAMILRSGKLGGAVQVTYGVKPTLKLAGDLYVEKLHTVDAALHDDLINWERLDVRGIDLQQGPQQVEIAEIAARKPYARVIIEPDATLNVARVLKTPGAAEPASAETLPTAAAPAAGARRPKPRGSKAVTVKVVEVKPAPAQPSSPMAIKKIRLEAGRLDFADLSVKPNFSAGVRGLEGTVLGLSSNPNSRAKVDLHGNVEQFSPVSITGEVNVLSAALYTDLTMDFRNIELSIFNPYSGKWAGYNIAKGKLSTEMHYKVVGRQARRAASHRHRPTGIR